MRKAPLIAAVLLGLASPSAVLAETNCYDAKIRARPIDQIPSEIPDCGKDCIIMSWPWFVDLQVKRVIDGELTGKVVRVLTVQHTYYVSRQGTWLLRRNAEGGYNALMFEEASAPTRCAPDASPARPYLRPGSGQTLDDLRDEGIRLWGHHTN